MKSEGEKGYFKLQEQDSWCGGTEKVMGTICQIAEAGVNKWRKQRLEPGQRKIFNANLKCLGKQQLFLRNGAS